MIITRDDVLKAIAKETLAPNHFVQDVENPQCSVCAVGAVLRGVGLSNYDIDYHSAEVTQHKYVPSSGSIPAELEKGNYMGALSMQFERFCEVAPADARIETDCYDTVRPGYIEAVIKPDLIVWVMDNLPDGVLYRD